MTLRTFIFDSYVDFAASLISLTVVAFHWREAPFHLLGIFLAVVCLLLWLKARMDLGNSFAVLPHAEHLITKGLYSKVRHPIYLFSTLFLFSLALASNERFIYLLAIMVAVGQIIRAHFENMVLRKRFGEEYRAYRKSTWL